MNEKQLETVEMLQLRLEDIIALMKKDEFYAPPLWTFESFWNTLESLKSID